MTSCGDKVFILFKSNGDPKAKMTAGTKKNAAAINSNLIAEILFFCILYLIGFIKKSLLNFLNKALTNKSLFFIK